MERSGALPGLPAADPEDHLDDERDRVPQCPLPALGQRLRAFPNETAALKRLYLTTLALGPTGKGRKRWTSRWKEAMNAFDIAFDGRLSAERVKPIRSTRNLYSNGVVNTAFVMLPPWAGIAVPSQGLTRRGEA